MPFKIYRSSAGSGKTFTLVKEYLRIALASDSPDNYKCILAVTFTNKAAEEMKSRVLEALKTLGAGNDNDVLTQLLTKELDVTAQTLAARASRTLKHMLHHYSDLSISTIDRFSHRIIRTFAQDLGLSINFQVELDHEILEHDVFTALMAKVGTDELLTDALVDFIRSASEDEKGWNIDRPIKEYIRVLFSEESRFHLEKLQHIDLAQFNALRKKLQPVVRGKKDRMTELASAILNKARQSGLSASSFWYGASGIYSFIAKTASGELKKPGKRITDTVELDKFYGTKITETEMAAVDALKPEITELVSLCETLVPEVAYLELVYNQIYAVALLDEMHRLLQNIQREEEIVHIGEFNHLISEVVMNESAPFIYERVGAKYHHFLIDEFQDTSILQWFNLLPLIDESLALDNLCLIVGDAKQSIYRWRGGDVQQFVKLPEIHRPPHLEEKLEDSPQLAALFADRERVLRAAESVQTLDSNFRSSPTVVNFNNSLFEYLQKQMPAEFSNMYDAAAQFPKKNLIGLVDIEMVRPEEDMPKAAYELQCFEQVKQWIHECLADGYSAGEIAIVFRTNKQAVATALYLVEKDIQVVSNESLLINNSPRVQLLVNAATFFNDPTDRVNVAELTHNLDICYENVSFGTELALLNGGADVDAVTKALKRHLPDLDLDQLPAENPYMLFSRLAHSMFGHVAESNITFFLDHVLSYTDRNHHSLSDFLAHWKEKRNKLSIALDESPDSVRILTIHKSKGLEFPVVIHPFADYPDSRSKKSASWVRLSDERFAPMDRLRLPMTSALEETPFRDDLYAERARSAMDTYNEMYVALTRAKQRVYVMGQLPADESKDEQPSTAIQYIRKFLLDSGKLNGNQTRYTEGERQKQLSKHEPIQRLPLSYDGNPDWSERLKIARPLAESEKELSGIDARQIGIAVHEAMENIITRKDIPKAVQQLVEKGSIGQQESERIQQHITNLLQRDELQHLFADGRSVRNEADIQLSTGEWVRPDRVVTQGEQAWVVDYKTGEQRKEHVHQMEQYMGAIAELGYQQVEGILVYLESAKVIRI